MNLLITITAVSALANLIAYFFEPLEWLKDKLLMYKWLPYAYCSKCVGLWLGVLIFGVLGYDFIHIILYSSLTSVIAYYINIEIVKVENGEKM